MGAVGRVTRGTTRPLGRVDKPWARARGAAPDHPPELPAHRAEHQHVGHEANVAQAQACHAPVQVVEEEGAIGGLRGQPSARLSGLAFGLGLAGRQKAFQALDVHVPLGEGNLDLGVPERLVDGHQERALDLVNGLDVGDEAAGLEIQ